MAKAKSRKKPQSVWVLCPGCKRRIYEALPTVDEYKDPHFNCKCGYKKLLTWRRNESGT